jgi:hypothetical protein
MSMLVNTGHSNGVFSGTGVGGGATFGGGVGAGVESFSGYSSSEHFGKVDLCVPCGERRLEFLRKRRAGYQQLGFLAFGVVFGVMLLIGVQHDMGFAGFVAASILGSIAGLAAYSPVGQIQRMIQSAVRNGREQQLVRRPYEVQ